MGQHKKMKNKITEMRKAMKRKTKTTSETKVIIVVAERRD